MTISTSATGCTPAGKLEKNGTDLRFCNGSVWVSANGAATATSCTAGAAGTIAWKSSDSRLEWCDGSFWRIVGPSANPCQGKTVGQACDGTTALYAGIHVGNTYMTMPSGCANSTSNPSCSGTDSVQKSWRTPGADGYDIPGITNVTVAATPSSASERGDSNTPLIAALSLSTQGGVHPAARHCADMVYGGYSDWYLPSKSEMVHLFCLSNSGANVSYPQENPNCGGSGPSGQLTGFHDSSNQYYWTSTESGDSHVWLVDMSGGNLLDNGYKDINASVRCIRRY